MKFSIRTQQYYNGEFRYFPIVTYAKHEYLGLIEQAKTLSKFEFIKFDLTLDDYSLVNFIDTHLTLKDEVDVYNEYGFYIPKALGGEFVGIITTETKEESFKILRQFHGIMCKYVPRYTSELQEVKI